MGFSKQDLGKLLWLTGSFALAAVLLFMFPLGRVIWPLFALAAVLWFLKYRTVNQKVLGMGLFLLVLDFLVETAGGLTGLWVTSGSLLPIGFVPGEILLVTFFGGMAWAHFQPQKPSKLFSVKQIGLLSFFGTIGEHILVLNGLMVYGNGWTSLHAFFLWVLTWILMAYAWQNLLLRKRELLGSWKEF